MSVFLFPIYFTPTGQLIPRGSFDVGTVLLVAGGLLLPSIAAKLVACTVAARLDGFSWSNAGHVGVMMHTHGLLGLVVITTGHQHDILPPTLFAALSLVVVVATLSAAPLLTAVRVLQQRQTKLTLTSVLIPGSSNAGQGRP